MGRLQPAEFLKDSTCCIAKLIRIGNMAKKKAKKSTSQKNDSFNFRIKSEEKAAFADAAKEDGFDSLAAWFLWLARNRMKEQKAD